MSLRRNSALALALAVAALSQVAQAVPAAPRVSLTRVADGLNVFDRMTRLGFDLAFRLEGRLVDDSGRPVSEDSLTRDRARLAHYFARMEERGIPAGGERALRLFV